jgi:transposase
MRRADSWGVRVTKATSSAAHLELVVWADRFGPDRRWAVEDCRQLSRRLEADLLATREQIVRVPPKLMAHARDSARTYGKPDPTGALAVARAALREPGLPTARLDGPERELRLLGDQRDNLVAERTRRSTGCAGTCTSWTRLGPQATVIVPPQNLHAVAARLAGMDGILARTAKRGPTSRAASPPAIPAQRHCAPSSAASPTPSTANWSPTPRKTQSHKPTTQLDIGETNGISGGAVPLKAWAL